MNRLRLMTHRQAKRFNKHSLLETSMTSLPGLQGLTEVEPLDQTLRADLQHIIDTKTKPPAVLGGSRRWLARWG